MLSFSCNLILSKLSSQRVKMTLFLALPTIFICIVRLSNGLHTHSNSQSYHDILAPEPDPFALPVPDMVRQYGYVCESHKYTTKDGYVNTLHHISPKSDVIPKRKAAFLQHGLVGTSADYVMGSPDKSLGYVLADQGFDVWLGNGRGNLYSREHVNLTENDDAYWEFSFNEMGKFDIPAAIEYIQGQQLNKSEKIYYVGHSMGTTMFWVAMNFHDQWMKDRVDTMFALAPVAKVKNVESPIRLLAPIVNQIQRLFKLIGIRQFEPSNALIQRFDEYACDKTMYQLDLCADLIFLMAGFDKQQMNMTLLPIILGHEPGGTSAITVFHFAQMINSGKFCQFDFGFLGNWKRYGQFAPPAYDLKKVDLPVKLFWSDNDWLADPKDVKYLIKNLPSVDHYHIPMKEFNHLDFIWGKDADTLIYNKMIHLMK